VKAWLAPEADAVDLLAEVPARAAALAASGARFLACPVKSNHDAALWALACFHSPVTFVPLPPGLPAPALDRRLKQLPAGVVFPDSLGRADPKPLTLRPREEIWAVIFSSGTTGDPKGIALTGAAFEASARAHAAHSEAAQACWLLDLPLHHVGGLSVLTRALFLHATVAIGPSRFSAADTKRWLASGRVAGLSLVPTTLHRLLEDHADFSRLDLVLLGGAPAAPALLERARAVGAPVRATYGMTEHASQIATETDPGSGLRPLPGVELRVHDGELLVRSPALASGVFRNGKLEPLPLRDEFFATGDLGELKEGILTVHGRKADVIISGGKKIHPQEVEAELARLPTIEDCAVIGLPDPEWGECAVAAVVEKSPGAFDAANAKAALRAALEDWKTPRRWVVLAAIPRTPSGKVLREELRLALTPSRS
jgi:O-succinylbenzoic acid--CoA ligase